MNQDLPYFYKDIFMRQNQENKICVMSIPTWGSAVSAGDVRLVQSKGQQSQTKQKFFIGNWQETTLSFLWLCILLHFFYLLSTKCKNVFFIVMTQWSPLANRLIKSFHLHFRYCHEKRRKAYDKTWYKLGIFTY